MKNLLSLLTIITLLNACSTTTGRYQHKHDSTPSRLPHAHEIADAIPRDEPKSRGGNKDYTVLGKHYVVLKNATGFKQQGIASYYGNKFHGHLTSNGEIYNMYSMSAAHKTLPLPSFVKVTNQENNKSVIVRVNDRGPFHENRIIDLSYSAAYKLGMLKKGTAPVTIKIINPSPEVASSLKNNSVTDKNNETALNKNEVIIEDITKKEHTLFIQVFATSNKEKAQNTADALTALYQQPVKYFKQNGIFKVQMGPLENNNSSQELLKNLKQSGYPKAFQRLITN